MKNRDNIHEFNNLIEVDINDKDELLAKHKVLNTDNDYLHFGLLRIDDKYYFFEVDNFVAEYKSIEGVDFLCPYCKEPLFARSGWVNKKTKNKVRDHLCHYAKNKDESPCIFRTDYKSSKLKKKYYTSESFKHSFVKEQIFNYINNNTCEIEIPCKYKIDVNYKDYSSKVSYEYEKIKLVECEKEKKVLNKDDKTNGYRPDILAKDSLGNDVYIEITNCQGKTVNEYMDIWKRLGKQVLEVKVSDYYNLGINFINLYNSVIEESRIENLKVMQELAGKRKLWETIKLAIDKYKFMENIKTIKKNGRYVYVNDKGNEVKSFWKCIYLNGYSKNTEELNQQIATEKATNEELNQKKEDVNSLEFIEEMAREKLDMYHPNERVYVDQGM